MCLCMVYIQLNHVIVFILVNYFNLETLEDGRRSEVLIYL